MENFKFIVEIQDVGERLDLYLVQMSELTRSKIQKLIEDGSVLVNGTISKANYKVNENDEVSLSYQLAQPIDLKPVAMDLDVVYEDEDLIVINKPKGLVVHPGSGNFDYTLVHGLLHHCKELSDVNGYLRPGIVHRIDKDTSGLLVCAKNDESHVFLSEQLADKTCFRKYYALVSGVLEHDEGEINAPIGRDPKDRQRMTVTDKNAKEAITLFKVLKRFNDATLVECELKTGRTHQIRVHMKFIQHPVINDSKYSKLKLIDETGQYLHAYYLSFIHPKTKTRMVFETEMPDYMQRFIHMKEGTHE